MQISFRNPNITTSHKSFGYNAEYNNEKKNSFTRSLINKSKDNIKELKTNEDKRYSFLGAGLGIAMLSFIGLALLNSNELLKLSRKKKK